MTLQSKGRSEQYCFSRSMEDRSPPHSLTQKEAIFDKRPKLFFMKFGILGTRILGLSSHEICLNLFARGTRFPSANWSRLCFLRDVVQVWSFASDDPEKNLSKKINKLYLYIYEHIYKYKSFRNQSSRYVCERSSSAILSQWCGIWQFVCGNEVSSGEKVRKHIHEKDSTLRT